MRTSTLACVTAVNAIAIAFVLYTSWEENAPLGVPPALHTPHPTRGIARASDATPQPSLQKSSRELPVRGGDSQGHSAASAASDSASSGGSDAASHEAAQGGGGGGGGGGEAEVAGALPVQRSKPRVGGVCNAMCAQGFRDASSNGRYAKIFNRLLTAELGVPWWIDEGGLIGVARGGSLRSADDDFDFFTMMPGQSNGTTRCLRHAPGKPLQHPCLQREFDRELHSFLMHFWNAGLCVNNFDPDFDKFQSKNRLMWSVMTDRHKVRQPRQKIPGKRCYDHKGQFAHMHLGLLSEDGSKLMTNVWSAGHPRDALPLSLVVPTRECYGGNTVVPCPADPVRYLLLRNNKEYAHSRSEGSCLLIRKKWGTDRRMQSAEGVEKLHACGCASLFPLVAPLKSSGYRTC